MLILIDNGHGIDTPGKRSPDGRLLEWHYTRRVAREVAARLTAAGTDARLLVTEDNDVPLRERCLRANRLCPTPTSGILVSIHCNAAGADCRWHGARGWSVFLHPRASHASRCLAEALHDAAEARALTTRRPMPSRKYWEMNLAICRDTICPAVLTENLFQDNRADVEQLLSPAGFESIVSLHVNAITSYMS